MSVSNVYYSPEAFGLTTVGELDFYGADYGFDLFVVWVDGEGVYYWGRDAGCSCPSPFEDITDRTELASGGKYDALRAVGWAMSEHRPTDATDEVRLVERIMEVT